MKINSFQDILHEKVLSMPKDEKSFIENEVIQSIIDAGKQTLIYKNQIASQDEYKKIAKSVEDILFSARREIEKIRTKILKGGK